MVQTPVSPPSPQSTSFCSLPIILKKCPSLTPVSLFTWTFLSPCLPNPTLKPGPSAAPPMPPSTGRTCLNASAHIIALHGLLPHSPLTWPAPLPDSAHVTEVTENALPPPLPVSCSSLSPVTCCLHPSAGGTSCSPDSQDIINVLFKDISPSSAQDSARNMEHSTICSMSE